MRSSLIIRLKAFLEGFQIKWKKIMKTFKLEYFYIDYSSYLLGGTAGKRCNKKDTFRSQEQNVYF